jgi:hypothetical protein
MTDIFADATITPTEIPAGDSDEFVIRLVVGPDYPDRATRIVFDFMGMLGTSCVTAECNEESGYVEAYVSNPDVTWTRRCWSVDRAKFAERGDRPREGQRMVALDLSAGIGEGDVIELHWGETLGGFGPGAKATIVVPRPNFEAFVDVRFFADQERGMPDLARSFVGYDRPEPDETVRLTYRVLPREVKRLRLFRQTRRTTLVPFDRFWNVADVEALEEIACAEAPVDALAIRHEQGTFVFERGDAQVTSKRLPMTETPRMDDVFEGHNLYWGDIHTHSAYSCDACTRAAMDMTPGDLMVFARERACLDFFAVTDHQDPAGDETAKIGPEWWAATLDDVREHNRPGEFVVFPGIEFRAARERLDGGPTQMRGDTVIVFNYLPEYDEVNDVRLQDMRAVWRTLAGRDFMSIPHFHSPGNLPAGEWWAPEDMRLEPVLEIYSDHGSYEREDALENARAVCKAFREDRCAAWLLKQGYRYGFAANSDDHKGHVGVNGVTAVFARDLTGDAIFEAYRARCVYATTNARIRLIFTGNDALMGSVVPNDSVKRLRIDVVGESTLKRVDVFRNGEQFERFRPDGLAFATEMQVREAEPSNWYVRVTQQDNHIAWSSPIWFE